MATILIVDDSAMFLEELQNSLELGGHEVVSASDGIDGLNKAQELASLDLIISDFNMPELNGIQMIEMIKKIDRYQSTPAFVLTTETSPELKKHATRVGVTAWILKPFMAKKLLEGIDKVLSKRSVN